MKKNAKMAGGLILATALFLATSALNAAEKFGPKIKLTCEFPAAEGTQKVKPGQTKVSDGVVRITPTKMTVNICQGCKWQHDNAKWKVTTKEYQVKTPGGIAITISRDDGSALFAVTSQEDELYFSGHAESRGQCRIAEKSAAPA